MPIHSTSKRILAMIGIGILLVLVFYWMFYPALAMLLTCNKVISPLSATVSPTPNSSPIFSRVTKCPLHDIPFPTNRVL